MKKNVLNEIKEMKYLFGYKPGKVISEQDLPEEVYEMEDDISFYDDEDEDMSDILSYDDELFEEDDDIMFAEPDVMDLDTDTQGELDDYEIEFDMPDVAPAPTREKERTKERETEKPFNPDRTRRERNPDRLPYTDPDTHPQGESDEDFDGDAALEKLVMKYLRSKN